MVVKAEKGQNIYQAIEDLQESLSTMDSYLDLEFNDIVVRVTKNSNINDLTTIYNLKHTINRLKLGYKD